MKTQKYTCEGVQFDADQDLTLIWEHHCRLHGKEPRSLSEFNEREKRLLSIAIRKIRDEKLNKMMNSKSPEEFFKNMTDRELAAFVNSGAGDLVPPDFHFSLIQRMFRDDDNKKLEEHGA